MWIETKTRSITKAILWRLVAVTNSFVISWLFFETIAAALGAALAMNVTGLVIYYAYERVWNKIRWGKETQRTLTNKDILHMMFRGAYKDEENFDERTLNILKKYFPHIIQKLDSQEPEEVEFDESLMDKLKELPKTFPDIPYEEDDDL